MLHTVTILYQHNHKSHIAGSFNGSSGLANTIHIEPGLRYLHLHNETVLSVSGDGGRSWSEPTAIVGNGQGCWQTELSETET